MLKSLSVFRKNVVNQNDGGGGGGGGGVRLESCGAINKDFILLYLNLSPRFIYEIF